MPLPSDREVGCSSARPPADRARRRRRAPPRGHKSWAVLAYLVLAQAPVGRARLAGLLFGDADDPLGALRWTLAQLRRALGVTDGLRGDPLELGSGRGVDVLALAAATPDPALARGELLEGVEPGAGEVFETWLLVERRRFAGPARRCCARPRSRRSPAARPLDAAALATRVLGAQPVGRERARAARALPGARGATAAPRATTRRSRRCSGASSAARPTRACAARGRRQDRRSPWATARPRSASSRRGRRRSPPARSSPASPACARRARRRAAVGDPALLARTLAALGEALVHAVRGRDEEGAAVLHEALALAETAREGVPRAGVRRGPGGPRGVGGPLAAAGGGAGRATASARRSSACAGWRSRTAPATRRRSSCCASRPRSARGTAQAAWSLGHPGPRAAAARRAGGGGEALDRSLALVEAEGWVAFQPFPRRCAPRSRCAPATRTPRPRCSTTRSRSAAGSATRAGRRWPPARAGCYEPRPASATRRCASLREPPARSASPIRTCGSTRTAWMRSPARRSPRAAGRAPSVVATLERVAARADMRELVVRAALHRAALGDPGALRVGAAARGRDRQPGAASHARITRR